MHSLQKIDNGIKIQKELFKMKKYIYNYVIKMKNKDKTDQIKEYVTYLKKELDRALILGAETDHFEINYLFSFFPSGFDINFDYECIEFVYYSNDKKVCGKGVIPPCEFEFRIDSNIIKFKFFDFEFDITDLNNAKFFVSKIMKVLEEKLNMTKLFIEPCISQLREDLNKKKKTEVENKKNEIENKKNKQLENMLLLVQENLNNKKEIKQNEEDIVNYKNMFESKEKDINKINNEYKEQKPYVTTLRENEEDEINDFDNDDLGKINVKISKKPNNFYSDIIDTNIKDINSKLKSNNNEFIFNNKDKKNIPKNNLPKVNKIK